jgi:hypothetical protein
VNTVKNISVLLNAGKFLSSCTIDSLSRGFSSFELVVQGVLKRASKWYSKFYCLTSAAKMLNLKAYKLSIVQGSNINIFVTLTTK